MTAEWAGSLLQAEGQEKTKRKEKRSVVIRRRTRKEWVLAYRIARKRKIIMKIIMKRTRTRNDRSACI